ncbi:polysaccharide pyruvyl transferase family protein [Dyadobacter chenhuakuii]|uniref:Polysaccharide pyruvyl transferase family protein n=1 Tax=Dyadobacter chenhuakuii TaxID=2909339 RepID=A0ABY4XML1_9BACT|nr:polysaccharide pyruvyl transferase family protein [Dyadobacter chenhuakuii]MCF2494196.1 polysaccharide pyruvyl transferase family protein [Dyadobacter chenhuakuii]USJ31323.1 polysaccharide pyruvyl transferase family protein [Dyadobacter chenhuakuii]
MNILITGANFSNKGAQLMLESLVFSVGKFIPNTTIVVSPLLGNDDKLKKLGIEKLNYPLYHYGNGKNFDYLLKYPWFFSLLLKLKGKVAKGTIELRDIDAVFDISGFAFGDKWGSLPLYNLAVFARKMKSQGTKFILFPQAFGSFEKSGMKESITRVVSEVDLLIARDRQSYTYITDTVKTEQSNIKLYQDITLTFYKKIAIEDGQINLPFVAIVPNERMLDKASASWTNSYVDTMANAIDFILKKSDLNVLLLIHAQGTSGDAKVGKDIVAKLDSSLSKRVTFFVEEDPVRLKSIIAKAEFMIGSRFHALASALSSNVPSIGTSWLHKYEMLFEDYGLKEFSFLEPSDLILSKIEALLDHETNNKIRKQLTEINSTLASSSERMWQEIKTVLNQ